MYKLFDRQKLFYEDGSGGCINRSFTDTYTCKQETILICK